MEFLDERRKRILLVEDEDAIRFEMRELLEEEGYSVEEATNGQEALDALSHGAEPDLVLLDLMMPVMDGWSLLEEIEAHHAGVPVVITTAADTFDLPRRIPRVHKPYALEPLLDMVQDRIH